jgi:hypothetical protein
VTEEERRRRGRPKLEEPGGPVSTWLRNGDHDRLIALARREQKSVSAFVRDLVKRRISIQNN